MNVSLVFQWKFLENKNQEKVPLHFYEELKNIGGTIEPELIISLFQDSLANFAAAHSRRKIYVYSRKDDNLICYDGFAKITGETYELEAILIQLSAEGQFNGVKFQNEFQDFFRILNEYTDAGNIYVEKSYIQKAIKILKAKGLQE